jgi:hypothetical protein
MIQVQFISSYLMWSFNVRKLVCSSLRNCVQLLLACLLLISNILLRTLFWTFLHVLIGYHRIYCPLNFAMVPYVVIKTRKINFYIATGPRTRYILITRPTESSNSYWKAPKTEDSFSGYSKCSFWSFSVTTSSTESISDLKPFHRRKELKPQRHVIGRGVTGPKYHWIIRIPLCYWIIRAEIAQIRDEHWLDGRSKRLPTETTAKKCSSVISISHWPIPRVCEFPSELKNCAQSSVSVWFKYWRRQVPISTDIIIEFSYLPVLLLFECSCKTREF